MIKKMIKHILLILIILAIFGLINCGGGGGGSADEIFSISYDANGAESGKAPEIQTTSIISDNIGNLAKNGYLFDGWNTKSDGTGSLYLPGSSYSGKSIKLYAKWTAIFETTNSQNVSLLTSNIANAPINTSLTLTGLTTRGKELSEITIPPTIDDAVVTKISEGAFANCTNITQVIIESNLAAIGSNVFLGCTSLIGIFFNGSIPPTISPESFNGCSAKLFVASDFIEDYKDANNWNNYVTRITIADAEKVFYYSIENDQVTIKGLTNYGKGLTTLNIPETIEGYPVTTIGTSAFLNRSSITGKLIIPNSVTTIESNAFNGCSGFTGTLTIPNSVTFIGANAFKRCTGFIGPLIIPNSITTIGHSAFLGCTGFSGTIIMPSNVTSFGDYIFSGCSGFTGVTIPNNSSTIYTGVFSGCSGITNLTIPNGVTSIMDNAFSGCSGLTGIITIPNSVTFIGADAFYGCRSISSIIIPNSISSLENGVFAECSGITSLELPNSVISIGDDALEGCSSLTSLSIPSSVTSIGASAFSFAGLAGTVTIPNSVTSIGRNAFFHCLNITEFKMMSTIPPIIAPFPFYSDVIKVPAASVEAYRTAENWSVYEGIIEGY